MMTDWDEDWDSEEEPRSAGERRTPTRRRKTMPVLPVVPVVPVVQVG